MTSPAIHMRTALAAAVLGTALLAPAAADAAKVKVKSGVVTVNDDGVAAIKVANPNRGAAKGRLALKSGGVPIGSRSFKVGGRRSSSVRIGLSSDAIEVLAQGYDVRAVAYAKAKGKGTSHKTLLLTYPGAASGGGGNSGSTGTQQQPPAQQQPASQSRDGRWQGTYETSNANLAFNISGNRLYTGPFDSFFLQANCDYNTDSTAIEPVEATINPDGSFSGSGTYRPSPDSAIPWTLTGHISGRTMTGTFSATYEDGFQGHCSGSMNFTAAWYGDYTL